LAAIWVSKSMLI